MKIFRVTKFNYTAPIRQFLTKNVAVSDAVGVDKIDPQSSSVTLRNGRTIGYENLVVAMGQKENYNSIKGFEDAWADTEHPFYTNADHSSWKSTTAKGYRVHYNFCGGAAYFYIPPNNYYG